MAATTATTYPRRWLAAIVMVGAVLMDMIDMPRTAVSGDQAAEELAR